MNRKNTQISAIIGMTISALYILGVLFMCAMIFAYGLFFKGTPKGDGNILVDIFEVLKFFTLLISVILFGYFGFMISYSLRVYKTHNQTVLDYKEKDALFKIYNILNVFNLFIVLIPLLLLCFKSAFTSTMVSVIIIYLAICVILLFLQTSMLNSDILKNNNIVKRESVSNIKEGNFNQKYGLGEYANKPNNDTNNTPKA